MKLRILLLAIGAVCLAALTQCTVDDGVWTLPVSPVSPISPLSTQGLAVLGVDADDAVGNGSYEMRETVIRPRWSESALEPGDLVLFECELRPGGSGAAVDGQQFALAYGQERALWWDVGDLEPGWWEVFCRASAGGRAVVELLGVSQDCTQDCGFVFVEHWER